MIRGGHQKTIRADEVVRGDLLVLEAGDAVPADARIVECASMKTQEAALTGESTDVEKQSEALQPSVNGDVTLGDRKNMVYMGSIVTYGRGHAVVTGTGMDTEMGAIAGALSDAKEEETPLQVKLRELSRKLSAMILVICVRGFPGSGSDSRGTERRGHGPALHRRDQNEQEPRDHPETDGG